MTIKRLLARLLPTAIYLLALPQFVLAAAGDADSYGFANSISLWIAIIVGVTASVMVLRNARRIGSGVLASVYTYFGIGMLLVVSGFFAIVIPAWAPPFLIGRVHDILFIIGYSVMAIGAKKIITAAGLK